VAEVLAEKYSKSGQFSVDTVRHFIKAEIFHPFFYDLISFAVAAANLKRFLGRFIIVLMLLAADTLALWFMGLVAFLGGCAFYLTS